MKTKLMGVACAVIVVSCSAPHEGPPTPTSCKRTDRTGTYMLTWTEQSGTCGKIDPGLVSLNGEPTPGAGCTIHSAVWSDGDCKSEVTGTCVTKVATPGAWGGYESVTNDAVAVTRQETADGSHIDGTFSVTLQSTSGASCHGVYTVNYVRQ